MVEHFVILKSGSEDGFENDPFSYIRKSFKRIGVI